MPKICLALLPLLFVSCATITRGVHDKLYVQSEPSGAEAKLSTGERALTPTKFIKSRKEGFTVTVSKSGYIPQTIKIESRFSATGGTAMAGNAIAGGVVGIGIDAISGATSSLYPNPVVVHLVRSTKSSTTQQRSASYQKVTKTIRESSVKSNSLPERTPASKPSPPPAPVNLPPIPSFPAPERSPTPEISPTL